MTQATTQVKAQPFLMVRELKVDASEESKENEAVKWQGS